MQILVILQIFMIVNTLFLILSCYYCYANYKILKINEKAVYDLCLWCEKLIMNNNKLLDTLSQKTEEVNKKSLTKPNNWDSLKKTFCGPVMNKVNIDE